MGDDQVMVTGNRCECFHGTEDVLFLDLGVGVSPRSRRALPPRAATIRTSVADRGDHDRLDGVEPVLGLVEDDRGG